MQLEPEHMVRAAQPGAQFGIDPKKWSLKSRRLFLCNEVACSKATGLTYCNIEWVQACEIIPKMLSGFSPFRALTRSLHFPHPTQGASPPGRSVVDGWCRDERAKDRPQSLPRSLVSAGKPTTGIQ